jgi:hypothetical protein
LTYTNPTERLETSVSALSAETSAGQKTSAGETIRTFMDRFKSICVIEPRILCPGVGRTT